MNKNHNKQVFWLLDSRFDFLLFSFMQEFEIEKQDIVLVNSYHNKMRNSWNKIYIPVEKKQSVYLMEPDDINSLFSKILRPDINSLVISFTGAKLPERDNVISLMSTGAVAEMCNNKWWQYCCFKESKILTPQTYHYCDLETLQSDFSLLIDKHEKFIIKKPCLSGGYQMKVISTGEDIKYYKMKLQNEDIVQDFLVSEYIPHQQSFASMGVVKKDRKVFFIDIITEQMLYKEVAYEGLLYPAFLDNENLREIRRMTERIGVELGRNGYYGFYNVDFVLGNDECLYAIEINARLGFCIILAACIYGKKIWKLLQGDYAEQIELPKKRLILGKIKGKEGTWYSNLKSCSDITNWFQNQDGYFKTFFCGMDEPELFTYGSYIGLFGEFFDEKETRTEIIHKFWEKCIEYYI